MSAFPLPVPGTVGTFARMTMIRSFWYGPGIAARYLLSGFGIRSIGGFQGGANQIRSSAGSWSWSLAWLMSVPSGNQSRSRVRTSENLFSDLTA